MFLLSWAVLLVLFAAEFSGLYYLNIWIQGLIAMLLHVLLHSIGLLPSGVCCSSCGLLVLFSVLIGCLPSGLRVYGYFLMVDLGMLILCVLLVLCVDLLCYLGCYLLLAGICLTSVGCGYLSIMIAGWICCGSLWSVMLASRLF